MVTKQEKFRKFLENEIYKLHQDAYPEDASIVTRPPDSVLYKFLDTFLEKYSWREDIFGTRMNIRVFDEDSTNGSYVITKERQQYYDILRWLNNEKYLLLTNLGDGFVAVHDVKEQELNRLTDSLQPDIIPAHIIYNPSTKVVIFNGVRHTLQQGKNLSIFHLLATNPNKRLSKESVWRVIGFRSTRKRDTSDFSKIVANVRTSVGASLEEIQLDGTVTLHANVEITE